jgi:hypothetical protein
MIGIRLSLDPSVFPMIGKFRLRVEFCADARSGE